VETLSGGGGPLVLSLGLAIGKAAMAIAAILMVGRLILRPLFRLVASARSPELFVGMALLIALGTSWGTEQVGLSMAFGGFLAGMLLGETEYRHQVAADVEPFRGLLLGLFFMTVGMIVDVGTVVREISAITLLALALMAGKTLIVLGLGLVLAMPGGRALRIGAILSQGGEFAFILFGAAAVAGLMPWSEAALLSAMVALTMLVTPVAARAARGITAHLRQRGRMPSAEHIGETLEVRNHVIIVGFGEIGRIVARMLRAYEVPYLILELNGDRIREARGMDEPVYYGNATRAEVLRGVKAGDALAVVVTTDAAGVAEGLAALRRHTFPDLNILVRGGGELSIIALRRAGLTPVGQEATDTGLKLTGAILDLWHAASPQSAD
jgi:CPA2 family monovalent cation:H+ antiporter-2